MITRTTYLKSITILCIWVVLPSNKGRFTHNLSSACKWYKMLVNGLKTVNENYWKMLNVDLQLRQQQIYLFKISLMVWYQVIKILDKLLLQWRPKLLIISCYIQHFLFWKDSFNQIYFASKYSKFLKFNF